MNKKKFDGSISEIMVAYKPNGDLDFEPVKKMPMNADGKPAMMISMALRNTWP